MTPLYAAKAYGAVMGQASPMGGASQPTQVASDFSKMLQGAIEQTQKSTAHAENMMLQQSQGKAELIDAVTAVASAEASLESVIAIRDQVISAYQEILRMPI
ncbi:MAG: flagellar hook-basal body complex protein FliE [Asticcacaulis sp.]